LKKLSVKEVEHIAFKLAREQLSFTEPIPDFATRFPNILESCLAVPFQTFGGKSLYKGLTEKSAILFYLMVKNHPFQNGNKRIAMTALFVFLYKNNKWLKVDAKELYDFAMWVATSNPKFKNETLMAADRFIRTYMIGLK
jgi:death on curing protein